MTIRAKCHACDQEFSFDTEEARLLIHYAKGADQFYLVACKKCGEENWIEVANATAGDSQSGPAPA